MRNTFEFHSDFNTLSIPCEAPREGLPEVAQDMAQLWGGEFRASVLRMETVGEREFPVYGQRLQNQEGNIVVKYEPSTFVTDLEISELNTPLQSTRCAAAILYLQRSHIFLADVPISFYGANQAKEESPEEGVLVLKNRDGVRAKGIQPYSFPNLLLLAAGDDDVFGGDEGYAAMAGIVGATDFDAFYYTWIEAEWEPTPLAAAQFLLAYRTCYYQP